MASLKLLQTPVLSVAFVLSVASWQHASVMHALLIYNVLRCNSSVGSSRGAAMPAHPSTYPSMRSCLATSLEYVIEKISQKHGVPEMCESVARPPRLRHRCSLVGASETSLKNEFRSYNYLNDLVSIFPLAGICKTSGS
eukprot:GHVU01069908.1.p1 GENE.GHVU01069908.1~~GHVU01069908.1.p1  ORF type:complete len:139 (+),score=2.65 GHVU01069908.1:164-580(+)